MAKVALVAVEEAEVPVEESPLPKRSRRKLILMGTALVLLLGAIGGVAWYFLKNAPASEPAAAPAKKPDPKAAAKAKDKEPAKDRKPSIFMNLETFTVNLQSDGEDRFLQTMIVFELTDEKTADAIKAQMPVIRSKLLMLLSSKTSAEINTLQGKDKLAEEIITEARKYFTSKPPDQALLQVHFNSFVIQ